MNIEEVILYQNKAKIRLLKASNTNETANATADLMFWSEERKKLEA